jgi:hypothetical protein
MATGIARTRRPSRATCRARCKCVEPDQASSRATTKSTSSPASGSRAAQLSLPTTIVARAPVWNLSRSPRQVGAPFGEREGELLDTRAVPDQQHRVHGLRHPAGSFEQPLDRGGVELGRRHALLGRSASSLESEDKALHAEAVAVLGLVAADDGDPVLAVRRLAQALEGARGWVGLVLDVAGEVESVLTECRSGRGDTRYEAGLYLGMGAAAADSGPIGWRGPGDAAPGPRRVGLRTRLSSSSRP